MSIVDNFPKKIPIADKNHDGLMSKDDKTILDGLKDKRNSLAKIIGLKMHSFNTINDMVLSTNLKIGESYVILGSESVLDDNCIRIYYINNDPTPIGSEVIHLPYSKLYAHLLISVSDVSDVNSQIANFYEQASSMSGTINARIANILNNTDTDTPTEVVDARLDENGVAYACLKDRLDALGEKVSNAAIKRYGVKFTGSSSVGTRLEDAVGLTAEASTNIVKGINDFDSIYPWNSIIRCNGYYTELGNFIVTAYEGEPGFALDGSAGNVWVEIPKFFIKEDIDSSSESMYICGTRLDGYRLPGKFLKLDGTSVEKVYISAFDLSESGSVSGVTPTTGNYNSLLELCKSNGINYCGFTVDDYEIIRFLFTVEYATRNSQTVMTGAASLCTDKSVTTIGNSVNSNRIIVARTSESLKLAVDQICSIYTSSDIVVTSDRKIVSIDRCNEGGEVDNNGNYLSIVFDGNAINIASGCYIVNTPWKTGSTNSVLGPSGSLMSNTLGIYPCRYRYIENPWGNQWSVLYQVYCKEGNVFYSKNIEGDYIALGYDCPSETGYISSLGYDAKAPSCRLANNTIGASSSTYYTDNFIVGTGVSEKQVAVGGSLDTGITSVGLYALNVSENKNSNAKFNTRLSYNY